MMINPMQYIDEHKNDSIEQLINERESLVDRIEQLEKIVFFKEKDSEEWNHCPGPDVQYQMSLEYLAELCKYIRECYSKEYVWGM